MENVSTLQVSPEALGLGAALAVGLLIGLERGWRDRDLPDGARIAGLRTFALTGLLGGVLSVFTATWALGAFYQSFVPCRTPRRPRRPAI